MDRRGAVAVSPGLQGMPMRGSARSARRTRRAWAQNARHAGSQRQEEETAGASPIRRGAANWAGRAGKAVGRAACPGPGEDGRPSPETPPAERGRSARWRSRRGMRRSPGRCLPGKMRKRRHRPTPRRAGARGGRSAASQRLAHARNSRPLPPRSTGSAAASAKGGATSGAWPEIVATPGQTPRCCKAMQPRASKAPLRPARGGAPRPRTCPSRSARTGGWIRRCCRRRRTGRPWPG